MQLIWRNEEACLPSKLCIGREEPMYLPPINVAHLDDIQFQLGTSSQPNSLHNKLRSEAQIISPHKRIRLVKTKISYIQYLASINTQVTNFVN